MKVCLTRIMVGHLLPLKCRPFQRRWQSSLKVAIIGSGPAGFYATQQLLKDPRVEVDIYEKYPVPFGLVRFGVAPDHPEVKNVINSFANTASNSRVSFYGNISIGSDVSLKDLKDAYNAVVLCYGSARDRTLDIEGENLGNVLSARRFVGWYNGVPSDAKLKVDLNTENVVIIGQGNVALDCARILLAPVDAALKKTDITTHALRALKESMVKNVYIVGRRGPLQVAFTIKEFREITKLEGCHTIISKEDCVSITEELLGNLPRPRKRLTELIFRTANQPLAEYEKGCILKFCRSPLKILGKENVDKVVFGVNSLGGDATNDKAKAVLTEEREEIECGLVLRSIGYMTISIDPSIPIDTNTGVIKNSKGRVTDCGPGVYVAGWAQTGATGVLLSTMNSTFEVARNILSDFDAKSGPVEERAGSALVMRILRDKNVDFITFEDWKNIDQMEQNLGTSLGKPREKLVDVTEMIAAAKATKKK